MAYIRFIPVELGIEVAENTKLLVAATKLKVPFRFGCASCRCGTCGVKVSGAGILSPMQKNEKDLLLKMGLDPSQGIRLACQARIMTGEIEVDLEFQNTYSPDDLE